MKNVVENIASDFNLTKKASKEVVDAVLAELAKELVASGEVRVTGLGTFKVKTRKERQGHNPKTKEKITIPESKTVGFKVSKTLKAVL